MSIAPSIAKVAEALAVWMNPERREKAILRRAIEAGEQLLMVLRKEGRYAKFSDAKLAEYEIHYEKQWQSWKDGAT